MSKSDDTFDALLQRVAATPDVTLPPTVPGAGFDGGDRFELGRCLGEGTFGVVYAARDRELGQVVALKVLRQAHPGWLFRFKREYRALAQLSHPNLVQLGELHGAGKHWFYSMELIEGADLIQTLVRRRGELRSCFAQLARGLAALHEAGILHRDLKPPNVLVSTAGRVVVLDFGLAVELDGEQSVALAGTPATMAPEQCAGQPLTAAADWYAVGVMLYQALTGDRPFEGDAAQVMAAKQRDEAPRPCVAGRQLPEDLVDLCVRLLARDPAARPTGAQVLDVLDVGSAHPPPPAPAPRFVGRVRELHRLHEALAATRTGPPQVLWVHGESGVGKTALLQRFVTEVAAQLPDAWCLISRCYEREAVPYKALDGAIDQLSTALDRLSASQVEAVLPRDVRALARLFPVLRRVEAIRHARGRAASDEPALVRRRALAALRELFARLADRRPVVIVIDDLQWGDADSALLVAELLRPPDPPSVLLVGSYRSGEARTSAMLRQLTELGQATLLGVTADRLELRPLADEEAKVMATSLLGGAVGSAADADRLVAEAAGSPLFLQELARGGGARSVRSLGGLLGARIGALNAPSRTLLARLAVAGRPLPWELLAAGAPDPSAALAVLRAERLARRRGESRSWECYHDRIREAVVHALSAEEIRAVHRDLAAALGRQEASDPRWLAEHLRGAGDPAGAAALAHDAARRAVRAWAHDHAAELYRVTLELRAEADLPEEGSIRAAHAAALADGGRVIQAADAYLGAARSADRQGALALKLRAADVLGAGGQPQRAQEILAAVFRQLGLSLPGGTAGALLRLLPARARLRLLRSGWGRRGRSPRRDGELSLEALRIAAGTLVTTQPVTAVAVQAEHLLAARRFGDRRQLAEALWLEAMFSALSGGHGAHRRTRRAIDELAALGKGGREVELTAKLQSAQAIALHFEGAFGEAQQAFAEAYASWEQVGLGDAAAAQRGEMLRFNGLWIMGRAKALAGQLPAAIQRLHERGQLLTWTLLMLYAGWLQVAQEGKADEAHRIYAQALRPWRGREFHLQRWWEATAELCTFSYEGRAYEAWAVVEEMWPLLRRTMLLSHEMFRIESRWMRARCAVGLALQVSPPRRDRLCTEADGLAGRIAAEPVSWGQGIAAALRGAVASVRGDDGGAIDWLRRAEPLLARASLDMLVATVKRARGRLMGGQEGQRLEADAQQWFADQGVCEPARFGAMVVPGRWDRL